MCTLSGSDLWIACVASLQKNVSPFVTSMYVPLGGSVAVVETSGCVWCKIAHQV